MTKTTKKAKVVSRTNNKEQNRSDINNNSNNNKLVPVQAGSASFGRYSLPAPHTICANAATQMQRVWRGRRSRRRVEFLVLVQQLRAAKDVSHDAAVAIQARIRGNIYRDDRDDGINGNGIRDHEEVRLDAMADRLLQELMDEMEEVTLLGTGKSLPIDTTMHMVHTTTSTTCSREKKNEQSCEQQKTIEKAHV